MSNTGEDGRTSPLKGLETESSSNEGGTSSFQRGWETPGPLRSASTIVEEEGGNTKDLTCSLNSKDGTGPLLGNNEITTSNENSGATQGLNTDVTQEGNSNQVINADDLGNMDQLLYNTASNIVRLREAKGECEVKRGYCKTHGVKAIRHTRSERIWTKVKKTGLFGWRTRKLSVLRCPDSTATLVETMGSTDGAGVT